MNSVRTIIERIFLAAVKAVNPEQAIRRHVAVNGSEFSVISGDGRVHTFELNRYKRVFVIGAGKASAPMARALEDLLKERITGGCVCVKYGHTVPLERISIVEAGHPIPDDNSIAAAKRILSILRDSDCDDLVLSVISGGGSALLCMPVGEITLEEKKNVTDLLLKSGASIAEMNSVRKHLSLVKGGNAAGAAYPATVINFVISDVVGDSLDVIASGPFVPDTTTFQDALRVLNKYGLTGSVGAPVLDYLRKGASGEHAENPSENDSLFVKVKNFIIASNGIALDAAKAEAESLGYRAVILPAAVIGEASVAAKEFASKALKIESGNEKESLPFCIIGGGETTVTVHGDGIGGRNMEFAMHAAAHIRGHDRIVIAGLGTDGSDGPTDAAGAVAFGDTVERASQAGEDIGNCIINNDSYKFFDAIGDLIKTGPTNTNVMDLYIVLINR